MKTPNIFATFYRRLIGEMAKTHTNEAAKVGNVLDTFDHESINIIKKYIKYIINSNYDNLKIISIMENCCEEYFFDSVDPRKAMEYLLIMINKWEVSKQS